MTAFCRLAVLFILNYWRYIMTTQSLNPLNIDQLNQAIQNEVKAWYEQYQSKVALMESTIAKQQLIIEGQNQVIQELKNTIELLAPTQVDKPQLTITTTEMTLLTGYVYDWGKLKKWCVENNYPLTKADYHGLSINDYPAQAWKAVYGIDISKYI